MLEAALYAAVPLEYFLVGNRDLVRLEALQERFDAFEVMGIVRQELRHSDFLAFLLDPGTNAAWGTPSSGSWCRGQ